MAPLKPKTRGRAGAGSWRKAKMPNGNVSLDARKGEQCQPPAVDPEFHALIPPLLPAECEQLEANILADGCRDPLVTWRGLLLDGHNRLDICIRHGLPYPTAAIELPDRVAAIAWIIRHQFGRRNLTPFQRAELALKLEPLIAEKAKENQKSSGGAVPQKSVKPAVDTQKELAKVAGVSHDTIHKAKVIAEKAPEPVKEQLRRGETSINAAYTDIRKAEQTANDPQKPWADFEASIRTVQTTLRQAARQLADALDADAATKQVLNRWAHYFSYTGTIGAVNQMVRELDAALPYQAIEKATGYITKRMVDIKERVAA